jgi:predicted dehydrogenase
MHNNLITLLLVGAGDMAISYSKVLEFLKIDYIVVGRSEKSAKIFYNKTNKKVFLGGIKRFIKSHKNLPPYAIVATNEENLASSAKFLIKNGVKNILLEKPGGLSYIELKSIDKMADHYKSNVRIGYNRRFYASVLKGKKLIEEDGGCLSMFFDFTEWSTVIDKLNNKSKKALNNWVYSNSSHVIDLAMYLSDRINTITSFKSGSLPWHKKGSIFTGSGKLYSKALFAYYANWESAGRWRVEINTKNFKFIYSPLEKLQIMKKSSISIELSNLDYTNDINFKPGLLLQTKAFITNIDDNRLKTIKTQLKDSLIYDKILCLGNY